MEDYSTDVLWVYLLKFIKSTHMALKTEVMELVILKMFPLLHFTYNNNINYYIII